jgi:metal-responsive CopG/Arc/MetJ family transcriptional regulator
MSSQSKQIQINLRLDNELYFKLKQYIDSHFSKRNKVINEAIRRFLMGESKR